MWPGEARSGGWVERFKLFRDRYHLKPVLALLLYVVIPVAAFNIILVQYPGLDPERFRRATLFIVPLGLLLTFVTLAQERHSKGTRARLCLDAAYVALSLLWLIGLLGGTTVLRQVYKGHVFYVDITPLALLAAAVTALNMAHDVFEYLFYRRGVKT